MEKLSDPFYHTEAWRAVRQAVLMRDHYLCAECLREYNAGRAHRVRNATLVHHIIPRTERPDLALSMDNLESLCSICHNQAHPEKGQRPCKRGAPEKRPPTGARIIRI